MKATEWLHWFASLFIKFYKNVELRLFVLIKSRVEKEIIDIYGKAGVRLFGKGVNSKCQVLQDSNKNVNQKKSNWDIEVHNPLFFSRLANWASMGLGESYMDNYWDCDDLVELSRRMFLGNVYQNYLTPWNRFLNYLELCFFNLQTESRAWEVGKKHYDLGNDLFESFLDPYMTYSCGYWKNASNLNDAQVNKMELIARKLKLKPGMRVLDVGCGWGGLCKYLAESHGVECVGVTISKEGVKYAKKFCEGLSCEFKLMDYRDVSEKFDRIVSVGMFEHVGRHNYRTFFKVMHRCMKDNGLFLLHSIGNNAEDMPGIEPFFHTYIFPNGYLPYYQDITKHTEGLYVLEDWHNFGFDYSKTLTAWMENFDRNWPKISHKYGNRFYRMWTYYLQSAAGAFKARKFQLWQIVLSKNGMEGGYESVR